MTEHAGAQEDAGEFWQSEPGWVLLDNGEGLPSPFNRLTSMVMLICDEQEHERVVTAMQQAECSVMDQGELRQHDA
jgi:hypothetical protein